MINLLPEVFNKHSAALSVVSKRDPRKDEKPEDVVPLVDDDFEIVNFDNVKKEYCQSKKIGELRSNDGLYYVKNPENRKIDLFMIEFKDKLLCRMRQKEKLDAIQNLINGLKENSDMRKILLQIKDEIANSDVEEYKQISKEARDICHQLDCHQENKEAVELREKVYDSVNIFSEYISFYGYGKMQYTEDKEPSTYHPIQYLREHGCYILVCNADKNKNLVGIRTGMANKAKQSRPFGLDRFKGTIFNDVKIVSAQDFMENQLHFWKRAHDSVESKETSSPVT